MCPLPDVQRILDKMDRLGLVECTTQNPLQCRLTKMGRRGIWSGKRGAMRP